MPARWSGARQSRQAHNQALDSREEGCAGGCPPFVAGRRTLTPTAWSELDAQGLRRLACMPVATITPLAWCWHAEPARAGRPATAGAASVPPRSDQRPACAHSGCLCSASGREARRVVPCR